MSWQNILKVYDPRGYSPYFKFGISGVPEHDITEHNRYPGKEVHGSGGNVNLLDPREVDIEGMISELTAKYGSGWTSLALDGADKGDSIILRDKQ